MTQDTSFYQRLGIETFINAHSCDTTMGGSIMQPAVIEAMAEASRGFISLGQLHDKVGARIAELTGNDAAFVCAGAASGLQLAGAACLVGTDPKLIEQLPETGERPDEFVVSLVDPHDYVRQGFRVCGGRLVEVGTRQQVSPTDYAAAIGQRTAAVVYFLGRQPKEELGAVIDIAHAAGVPVIVDAADQLPPRANLTNLTARGADLVVFSGGKGICGPQSSGLVLGRRDLVEACRLNSSPHSAIGRGMKVGKEELAGLLTAVELFMSRDEDAAIAEWERRCRQIGAAAEGVPGVQVHYHPPFSQVIHPAGPLVELRFAQDAAFSAQALTTALENSQPSIRVRKGEAHIYFAPYTLQDGEAETIATRLKEIFQSR
jgi:D-glucosaminate-6-phosphate ammonia-lyase